MIRDTLLLLAMVVLLAVPAEGRKAHGVSSRQVSDFQRDAELYPGALLTASQVMAAQSLDANPHVYTTVLRPQSASDAQRAKEILEILRSSMAQYKDYRAAIGDGYEPFMPQKEQPLYWFISDRYAYASVYEFNPGHPTCLLYRKSKGTYQLTGALFTAPKNATESQLNDRIPLSVARWHEHVNLCVPPKHPAPQQARGGNFGLKGTIATHAACAAAGGRWIPQVFGWMVAVYPFASNSAAIWPH